MQWTQTRQIFSYDHRQIFTIAFPYNATSSQFISNHIIHYLRNINIPAIIKIDFSLSHIPLFLFTSTVMDTLTDEILHICAYLSDKDNIHLSATFKRFSVIKFQILFFTEMHIKDIIHLSYFHQFSNVTMSDTNESLPKHVTHLTFGENFDQPINSCIPDSVTHLTFSVKFNQQINGCISNSVTHLTFGDNFDRPINGCMPDSVTHLTLGYNFDQNIDELPISIINISLSRNYKRSISEKMLPKVTIRR